MAPMKLGVQTATWGVSWEDYLAFWRFIDRETLFDSLWTVDHFVPSPGDPDDPCFEGHTALAALAQATGRVRLGCLVSGVTYRHPSLVAKIAATVDHISNGRLILGLGAAWQQAEHQCYGFPFPSVREREERLEEAAQLLRLLFTAEGRVSFRGVYYQLEDAPFAPRCVQQPHVPIMIGGDGERRTLRTAARYGDMMNVRGSPEMVRRKIEVLERHCADAGRDPAAVERTVFGPLVMTDNEAVIERASAVFATWIGASAEEARRVLPIGPKDHVLSLLHQYAELGVSQYIMASAAPFRPQVYERIAEQVLPALS